MNEIIATVFLVLLLFVVVWFIADKFGYSFLFCKKVNYNVIKGAVGATGAMGGRGEKGEQGERGECCNCSCIVNHRGIIKEDKDV